MLNSRDSNVNGILIALEGESKVISTHIRSLPPSRKILTFPTLQECISYVNNQEQFEPKSFIKNVHAALKQRLNVAHSFLQSGEPKQPRLVFMNGGTLRARTICIEGICKNLTAGDIGAAEALFNNLTRDGLSGLFTNEKEDTIDKVNEEVVTSDKSQIDNDNDNISLISSQIKVGELKMESPEKRSLAQEKYHHVTNSTSTMSSSFNQESLMTIRSKNSKISHQLLDNESLSNINANSINGDLVDGDKIIRTTFTLVSNDPAPSGSQVAEISPACLSPLTSTPSIPGAYLQDLKDESRNSSRLDLTFNDISFPSTPTTVERIKFTSKFSRTETPNRGRPEISTQSNEPLTAAQPSLSLGLDSKSKKRPRSIKMLDTDNFDYFSSIYSGDEYRTAQSIDSQNSDFSPDILANERHRYVDRGCNTEEPLNGKKAIIEEFNMPIFEVVEDIIIHFADSSTNTIYNNVLCSYQDANFSSHRPTSWSVNVKTSKRHSELSPRPKTSYPKEDKFHSQDNVTNVPKLIKLGSQLNNSRFLEADDFSPPTPALISAKIRNPNDKSKTKFLTFSAANSSNFISAHNCFRRLLSSHLPSGKDGYSQYDQSVASQIDRIWKPVFGNWNISECVLKKTTIDQIIALGCGNGGEEDFSQISGMVERLGTKKSGQSRSDKIDISYLISNAMQHMNAVPFNQQTTDPQPESSVIANLLVPQLESYFAHHSSVQFLVLHFSSSQIPIVFALRELLGSTLFKIAGIPLVSNVNLTQFPSSPTSPNPLSNESVSAINENKTYMMKKNENCSPSLSSVAYSVPPSPSTVSDLDVQESFSGADFILSDISSNEEITRFISDIRQILLEKSNFYVPEPEPEPRTIVQVVEKYISAPPVPVTRPSSQHRSSIMEGSVQDGVYKSNSRRQSCKTNRYSNNGIHTPLSEFIAKRNYAASIASSRRTYASSISELEGWENFEIGDDESDFDEYDRMILGSKMSALILGKQIFGAGNQNEFSQQGVASKRKALKWLGLA